MKKIFELILVVTLILLCAVAPARAQTVENDLIGLGMEPEIAEYLAGIIPAGSALDNNVYLKGNDQAGSADINIVKIDSSDNTVLNSSASDELIFQLEDDASRLISYTAASDAALAYKFGDGGTTATQILVDSASTADADDDSTRRICGGGAYAADGSRGACISLPGEEVSGGGDIAYVAGASDTHVFSAGSTQTMSIGATGLVTAAAGFTATTGDVTSTAGNVILSAQDQQVQVLSGVASVDADVIAVAADSSTTAYVGSNTSGNKIAIVSNIADAVGGSIAFLKTRAAVDAWNANTISASGDDIGELIFYGSDGAAYINAARIYAEVAAAPGLTTDMPGALVFQTVPDGSGTLTTALTIEPDQDLLLTGDIYLADGQNLAWVPGNSANQACDTTCTGGCIIGFDAGASAFVACATATADTCVCTK